MVQAKSKQLERHAHSRRGHALIAALLLLLCASSAFAQRTSAPTGDAYDSLPGLVETRVAAERSRRVAASIAAGYGYTEALAPDDGSHQRVPLLLSAAGYVLPRLALSLRIDERYDSHPKDGYGPDSGGVIGSQLGVRGVRELSDRVSLGAQATGILVGASSASQAFDALSIDATALLTYRPADALTLALEAGYLLDRSAGAYDARRTLHRGDYVAWGASDYDALLARAGAGYRLDKLELLAEIASRVLIGSGAPTNLSSIHANAGVRYHFDRRFQLAATTQFELGDRPHVGRDPSPAMPFMPQDKLVAIDPRVLVLVGFRYAWEPEVRPPSVPVEPAPAPEPVPVPETRVIAGRVVDDAGQPLADVAVQITVGEAVLEQRTDIDGAYRFDAVPPGEGSLRMAAAGFATLELPLTGAPLPDPAQLSPAHTGGQLQGLLRTFDGKPVRGTVVVRPTNATVMADAAGRFALDLAPGDYQVQIRASGFRRQVRNLTISEGGVTILNVELHPAGSRDP